MTKFARKMYVSGWRESKRKEILLAGIKGYQKQLDLDQRGIWKLYRPQEEGKTKRVQQKLNGRADGFRRERDGESSSGSNPPGSDPASGNGSQTQVEGLEQLAPHQRPGGVSGNVLHRSYGIRDFFSKYQQGKKVSKHKWEDTIIEN